MMGLLVAVIPWLGAMVAEDPLSIQSRTDVYVSGTEGYHTFRIPSVIAATNGDLLAFAEGRKGGRGDAGDIDLVLRRSEDGGRTWSDLQVVWDDAANTCGNPCPVVDRTTGTIHLLMTHNLGHDREPQIIAGTSQGTRTVWITRSEDHGLTWSTPEDITATTKQKDWTWYATGPGAGIQVERGMQEGRLVIPCDHIEAGTRKYYSHVIVSDDQGATWTLGGSSPRDQVNECEVVELSDGRLLLNMRNYDRAKKTRQVCVSADGGMNWTDQRHEDALIEPICQASLRRLSWPTADGRPGVLAFSNPASQDGREKMTLRLSRDDGQTWPVTKQLYEGGSAYSCLVDLPDRTLGCLFEADGYRRIEFVRVAVDVAH